MVFITFSRHLLEIRVSFLGSCPGGVSGRLPGCFLEGFGHPLEHLGAPLGRLGTPLDPFLATLASLWPHFGAHGVLLGASGGQSRENSALF